MGLHLVICGMPAAHGDSLQFHPVVRTGTPTTTCIRRDQPMLGPGPICRDPVAELGNNLPHVLALGVHPGQAEAWPIRLPVSYPDGLAPHQSANANGGHPVAPFGASSQFFRMPSCMTGAFYQTAQGPGDDGGGDSSSSSSDT